MKRYLILFFLIGFCFPGCIRVVTVGEEELQQSATEAFQQAEAIINQDTESTKEALQGDPVRKKRPIYMPRELVEYQALSGDTLNALAVRFNTSVEEIRAANPIIPEHTTTLPQGLPMQIPIYYRSSWGSSFNIIPDALFVYGPPQSGFSARSFTDRQPGWFKYYSTYTENKNLRGGEVIDTIAANYSLSPRLMLAILEYMTGALSNGNYPEDINESSALRFPGNNYKTLSSQFNQLSDFLNDRYYRYKEGLFVEYELQDGSLVRLDPWINASTAALQAYFAYVFPAKEYYQAIGPNGLVKTYKKLFGDFPDVNDYPANLPGSLEQIDLTLPFNDGEYWTYTGGPHTAWGSNMPYSAIDFAPPSNEHGCFHSTAEVIAPHSGTVVRTGTGMMMLDMDEDGDEHTGWNMLFMHLKTETIPPVGTKVKQGDFVGNPSCDGGTSSGTHVHIARKYNGEWIGAGSEIPMDLDDWIVGYGDDKYTGTITRFSSHARSSASSEYFSTVYAGKPLFPTPIPKKGEK